MTTALTKQTTLHIFAAVCDNCPDNSGLTTMQVRQDKASVLAVRGGQVAREGGLPGLLGIFMFSDTNPEKGELSAGRRA